MARTVTLTFTDGTTHQYQGVPDEATPDQVMSRAQKDFPNLTLKGVDGGKTAAPAEPSYSDKVKAAGDKFDKAAGTGINALGNTVAGALDVGAHMVTGVAGDVAGAVTSMATQDAKKGEAVKNKVSNVGASTSESGKAAEGYVAALTAPLAKLLNIPVDKLKSSGHPIIAQVAQAAIDLAGTEEGAGLAGDAGKIVKAATKEAPISTAAKVEDLAKGAQTTKAAAGKTATTGIGKTVDTEHAAGSQAYQALEKALPGKHQVDISNTMKEVKKHGTGLVVDPKVKAVMKTLHDKDGQPFGSIMVDTARKLKSDIDAQITRGPGATAVDKQLKDISKALDSDIDKSATKLGPKAAAAYADAKAKWTTYKTGMKKLDQMLGKNWQQKTPEAVYQKLFTAAKNSPTNIKSLMERMGDDTTRATFAKSVMRNLGMKDGEFNVDQLVQNYKKMDPEARSQVFGALKGGTGKNLDGLIKQMDKIKAGKNAMGQLFNWHDLGYGGAIMALHYISPHLAALGGGAVAVQKAVKLLKSAPEVSAATVEAMLSNPKTVRALKNTAEVVARSTRTAERVGLGTGVAGQQANDAK